MHMTKWFVLVFVIGLSGLCLAQSESATLSGRVSDSSGAAIAGADVVLTNTQNNSEQRTKTNNDGLYVFAGVHPGTYRVAAGATGFRVLIKEGLTLHVQDEVAENFSLTLGAISESITVSADATTINTTDASVSTVIDRQFVENIPLNGRSFQTLIMLTPGVVVTAANQYDQGQFSVNGQRADANYFTVDGVSANIGVTGVAPLEQSAGGALPALSALGGTNSLVSVDAMQEFRIQTSSFAPEFGRSPGGQISIVTRSGTNGFHGALFDYFRNSVLDANDWFANYNQLPKPGDRQNDFGGVVGGPIFKDKTFFFFSYEGLRLRQPSTAETVVPDAASRQQAQATMPAILPYLNAFPVPNGAELGGGLAQFNAGYSNPTSLNAYSIRLDHVINSKFSLFGRYSYSPSTTSQRNPVLAPASSLSNTESASFSVQTLTLGLTEIINPRISNEVRANYSNDRVGSSYALDNFGGAVPPPDSLLFPSGFTSANGVFNLYIPGAGEIAKGKYATDEQRQVNLVDNLSLTTGSHQLKFGVDYRWLSPFTDPYTYRQFAEFTGMSASPGGALSGIALAAETLAAESDALLAHNLSFYGQDTWKATHRLTLTYGLRWDINPPLKGTNLANDPFTVTGLSDPATMTLAPRGTPLYKTTYGNVAPRVGLAYELSTRQNWNTVLRGGFGVFYDLGTGTLGAVSYYFPYTNAQIAFFVPFPLSPQNAAPPPLTLSPPVSVLFVTVPNLKLPRTYQWNVAMEQSLGGSQSLSLTYVGAVGRDLLRETILYQPNANFSTVSQTDNTATSNYNALQVKFQRGLSKGLQALASYTFSHSIDNSSSDAATYLSTPGAIANPNLDRGDSDFDIRHSFTGGVTYNLPSAPASQKGVNAILSNWSVDGFVLARSAPPVDIIGAFSVGAGYALTPRPDVVPGVPLVLYGSQYPGGKEFNAAAFTPPPSGQQGDLGRNVLRGFGAWQADFSVQRQFHLTEKMALRFRAEFFNVFNHPNFGSPDNTLGDLLFGQSTQMLASSLGSGGANGGFNPLYQIGGPRSIQLALKLQF